MHENLEFRDIITIGSRMAGAMNDHFRKRQLQDEMGSLAGDVFMIGEI